MSVTSRTPKPVSESSFCVCPCWSTSSELLGTVFLTSIFTTTATTPTLIANIFYDGPELPVSIFGEFLAIPSTARLLGPLSYFDISMTLPPGSERGNGQHFGASALKGEEDLFLDAFRHWKNFTSTFQPALDSSVLSFTPVLDPQLQVGRGRGGNVISPPNGGYAAVQISQQFPSDFTEIPADVEQGIQLLFKQ